METMIRKEIIIGFLVAIVATSFGLFLYLNYLTPYTFDESVQMVTEGHLWGKVLGIAALPNLAVFFIYLKRNKDYRARGVMLASFFIAFLVLIAQFL